MTMVPSQSRPPPEPGASRPNKTLNRTLSRKISLRRDGSDYGGICCPLIERHYRRPSYTCSTFPYKRHYAFRRKSYILVSGQCLRDSPKPPQNLYNTFLSSKPPRYKHRRIKSNNVKKKFFPNVVIKEDGEEEEEAGGGRREGEEEGSGGGKEEG
ncbi:hypothetical protein M8J76_009233 [Diaphorina citri]|nr:hypothetical protein M8J76_009233 [Diaphorina citri]